MKVRYCYARQIPTRQYGYDRLEVEVIEDVPEDIPTSQFLFELRELVKDELDAAETELLKSI